ncbi:putative ATPase/putative negative regulator of RcsB-dependent stress response [Friedmanniella endophytica]|uniref:Putative ATPase/putative negative regulator of RcsB-dependent stress response n=2 Tax=Microlunatus kandeliicorticis TaxID=1759536 RepID=A0A7W3IQM2_9ACTN|nr:putative ATPase/putative negative regulator of RcsB-dependent stress response [Microlunatus kandeliicorticis]
MIRTPDHRLRVFVSSTLQELLPERQAARAAIRRLHLSPVMFELGARPYPPRDLYRAYLEQSHIFVGIYWQRYGWVAPGEEISGLEDEYRLCGPRPKLIYVKRPQEGREPRLTQMLRSLQSDDTASYKPFETAAELQRLLADDLALLLTERFEASLWELPPPARTSEPEEAGTAAPAAPVGSAAARRWPRATTALIGREAELDELADRMADPAVQLITLLGPGGIGKTRLAIALAERLRDTRSHGDTTELPTVFVGLQAVDDADLVLRTIADALGVGPREGEEVEAALERTLAGQQTLIVLDNFEQVNDAAPALARLIEACPGLELVVTSRTPLRIAAEVVHPVPPLGAPEPSDHGRGTVSLAAAEASPGVALFVARAQAVRPNFRLTGENATATAELVQRLDGLPLAIELAAARAKLLTPAQLLGRLDRRFDLLEGGNRDLPDRQRTLRGTIDWSFGLLDAAHQQALTRLGVFVGGWTMDAAEAICDPDPATDFLDRLATLVDASLVVARDFDDEIRFGLLRSVRAYAVEKLEAEGDADALRQRHADYYLGMAQYARQQLNSEQQVWLDRVEAEHDNLRAALSWYLGRPGRPGADPVKGAELTVELTYFWWIRGYYSEGRRWLEQAVAALPDDGTDEQDHVRALASKNQGVLAWVQGDYAAAQRAYAKALPIFRRQDDQAQIVSVLGNLGIVAIEHADYDEAADLLGEALEGARRLGDDTVVAPALVNLAVLLMRRRELETAERYLVEATGIFRRDGDFWRSTTAQINLAEVQLARGDRTASRETFVTSLTQARELGDLDSVAYALEGFASLAVGEGDDARAARLWAAADRLRESSGNPRPPSSGVLSYDDDQARARERLGPEAFRAAWAEGTTLDAEQAADLALALAH